MKESTIRLDKLLSNAGIIARRGVKHFLKENEVTVNGKRVTESGIRVNVEHETVLINGKKLQKPAFVYFLLNKPIGIISSTADEFARDTVTSLIDTNERIYPVGRLDKDSHGLVLLTNDGELTHQLIHPRYHVPKVYEIIVEGTPSKSQLEKLRMGVILSDGITLPAEVLVKEKLQNKTLLQITLHEGRNRQIRRMCEEVGLNLLDLKRIAFGPLQLGNLEKGNYRKLTESEVKQLRDAVKRPIVRQ